MPGVEIPPWIKAADPTAEYARGAQIGASIAEASESLRQRAADNAERTAMLTTRLEQQREMEEQQHALQKQRLATSAAYDQQRIQLAQDRLRQAAQVNAFKTQQAARQYAARQTYQKAFSDIDASNLSDEEKQKAKNNLVMRLGPELGTAGTALGEMMRMTKPNVPAKVEDIPGFTKVTQPSGSVSLHAKPKPPTDNVKVQLSKDDMTPPVTMSRAQALQVIPSLPPELQTNAVNRAVMSGQKSILKSGNSDFAPVPALSQRKANTTYKTPKGLYTWTGKGWTPYEEPSHEEGEDAGTPQ